MELIAILTFSEGINGQEMMELSSQFEKVEGFDGVTVQYIPNLSTGIFKTINLDGPRDTMDELITIVKSFGRDFDVQFGRKP